MRSHAILLACSALLVARVASQTSNVTTCVPLYQWSINSKNQTPCLVAAFLESVCEGPVEVNTIPENNHYTGPSSANATLCRCSTVTYSLISACGGCQNRNFINWTDWAANCPQVEVAQFLQTVPEDVVVPAWAYLDVTKTDNTFNPILASANQSASTSSVPASSSSVSSALSATTSAPSSTPSVSPPAISTSHKSNAGAIAGGVVGGLVGVLAAALAVLYYLRRRNRPLEDSRQLPSSFSTSPPPMQEHESAHTAASPMSISPFPYESFPKDMSETGHFPGSPVMSDHAPSSVATPAIQIVHRYTGSAEI